MGKLLKNYNKDIIDNLMASMDAGNTTYYMFAARPYSFIDDNNPPGALESYQESIFVPLDGLLFGKRIKSTDVRYMIPKHTWTANTTFTQYDHTDISLYSKAFFVVTDENKVYKCLFNNRGVVSNTKPTLTQNSTFTTADGYVWKYMFTVSSLDMSTYSTSTYIPYTANTTVQNSAFAGIDVINIVAGGSGYITSTTGIVQSVNANIIQLQNNAQTDNHFYDGSTLYITNGSSSGQFRPVTNYVVNSTGNWAYLSSNISSIIPSQTTYEINPSLVISGDGTGATAICRTSNGVISSVIMTNNGNNYTHANVSVIANTSYGSGVSLIASIPPLGGHGSHPIVELGCDAYGVTINFANNEGGTIPTEGSYRTYGILKNPKNANGTIITSNTFSQVFNANTTPATVFTIGNIITGNTSGGRGRVVFSNSTVLIMSGDKTFVAGEVIRESYTNGSVTGVNSAINTITSNGAIKTGTPEVLYITNITPVPRSNTSTETAKLVIKV